MSQQVPINSPFNMPTAHRKRDRLAVLGAVGMGLVKGSNNLSSQTLNETDQPVETPTAASSVQYRQPQTLAALANSVLINQQQRTAEGAQTLSSEGKVKGEVDRVLKTNLPALQKSEALKALITENVKSLLKKAAELRSKFNWDDTCRLEDEIKDIRRVLKVIASQTFKSDSESFLVDQEFVAEALSLVDAVEKDFNTPIRNLNACHPHLPELILIPENQQPLVTKVNLIIKDLPLFESTDASSETVEGFRKSLSCRNDLVYKFEGTLEEGFKKFKNKFSKLSSEEYESPEREEILRRLALEFERTLEEIDKRVKVIDKNNQEYFQFRFNKIRTTFLTFCENNKVHPRPPLLDTPNHQ